MKEVGGLISSLPIQVCFSKGGITLGHAEFHLNYASFKNVKSQIISPTSQVETADSKIMCDIFSPRWVFTTVLDVIRTFSF